MGPNLGVGGAANSAGNPTFSVGERESSRSVRHVRAIVIPGHSHHGVLSGRCLRVLAQAAALAEAEKPAVVVFSGWSPIGGTSEAEQMLEAWPGRRDVELVVEPSARRTSENAARTLPLLRARGIDEAIVVCAPVHAARVRYFFGGLYPRFGITCTVRAAACAPTPAAVAWELAALGVMRRQRRAALAELDAQTFG